MRVILYHTSSEVSHSLRSITQPQKTSKAPKPKAPIATGPIVIQDLINLNTQELENLLEEEEEFYEAAEEFEQNIGINNSMVNWYQVNFQSSFVNTGEFASNTGPIVQENEGQAKMLRKPAEGNYQPIGNSHGRVSSTDSQPKGGSESEK